MAIFFLDIPVHLQIGDRAFHRAPGEAKISGNGFDPKPAFTLGGRHAFKVHVDGFCPVRQAGVGIDCVKITDGITSSRFDMRSIVFCFPFIGFLIVFPCVLPLLWRILCLDRFDQLC